MTNLPYSPRKMTVNPEDRYRGLVVRFWSKVAVASPQECWEWLASRNPDGYGQVRDANSVMRGAHRVSWELCYGPIPEGLKVCHKCDNTGCVNPYHFFLGTARDNNIDCLKKGRRGTKALRPFCKNGHAMTPDNCYEFKTNFALGLKVVIQCKACQRKRRKDWENRHYGHS